MFYLKIIYLNIRYLGTQLIVPKFIFNYFETSFY